MYQGTVSTAALCDFDEHLVAASAECHCGNGWCSKHGTFHFNAEFEQSYNELRLLAAGKHSKRRAVRLPMD